jgi:hypothetical protein
MVKDGLVLYLEAGIARLLSLRGGSSLFFGFSGSWLFSTLIINIAFSHGREGFVPIRF